MLALGPLGIGPFELVLILAVVVIIFGVGRLPEVGGAVGRGIREFRRSAREEESPRQITEPTASASEAPPGGESSTPESGPFCSSCGAMNEPGAKFCSKCGSALQAHVN